MTRDQRLITPSDIEEKLRDLTQEVSSVPGVVSLLKKASPSLLTLAGFWIKGFSKKKTAKSQEALIQIQLFPKFKKYLFNPTSAAVKKRVAGEHGSAADD